LRPEEIQFTDAGLQKICRSYTREAGVRNLEREIGSVCRKVVTRIAEAAFDQVEITPEKVQSLLGRPLFFSDQEIITRHPSLCCYRFGLDACWRDVLFIEATRMPGNKGFQITGSIGNVMQESARAALSYVRAQAKNLDLPTDFFEQSDIHLHIPAGSQPKDGPSAGVAMATALVSLISGRPVRPDVGMTGEITLRGQVLPVGGVKER